LLNLSEGFKSKGWNINFAGFSVAIKRRGEHPTSKRSKWKIPKERAHGGKKGCILQSLHITFRTHHILDMVPLIHWKSQKKKKVRPCHQSAPGDAYKTSTKGSGVNRIHSTVPFEGGGDARQWGEASWGGEWLVLRVRGWGEVVGKGRGKRND